MSKDKITVNMNIYDIPILVEELKYLNKKYIDRREFKIISPSGDIIKEWWRK